MTRILIVDDHPIFRTGMTELLNQEEGFSVCAVAEDIHSARKALIETEPDMAVVDISLAADNGLDLVKEIVKGGRNIPFWSYPCMMSQSGRRELYALAPVAIS